MSTADVDHSATFGSTSRPARRPARRHGTPRSSRGASELRGAFPLAAAAVSLVRRPHWRLIAASCALSTLATLLSPAGTRVWADGDLELPVSRAEHNQVLKELAEMRAAVDALHSSSEDGDSKGRVAQSAESRLEGDHAGTRLPGHKGGLYDKPFLEGVGSKVSLGGYFDVEYRDPENQRHEFRFHRLIPFIYADVHERVRFATEIEIEDGSEVAVEFSYLDFLIVDQINFRGGVILDPLGKFNLIHDSPINDLTDRPLINQFVIPTTLREVGAGFFGDLHTEESTWEIKYEAYITSGFKGLDNSGTATITSARGLRNARAHRSSLGTRGFDDINNKFAGVGRLSLSPFLGSEFGISGHSGAYDEAGDNNLTTGALDALVTLPQFDVCEVPVGPIELLAEGAYSWVERDSFARASGVADDLWGYYAQMNYHFMPAWLVENVPALFLADSTFTFVVRWGQVDLDAHRQRRLTTGLNYRPVESAAIKIDYQFNHGTGKAPASADDDAVVISLTSYF